MSANSSSPLHGSELTYCRLDTDLHDSIKHLVVEVFYLYVEHITQAQRINAAIIPAAKP